MSSDFKYKYTIIENSLLGEKIFLDSYTDYEEALNKTIEISKNSFITKYYTILKEAYIE